MKEVPLMGGARSDVQKLVERMLANREWLDQNIDELISSSEGKNIQDFIDKSSLLTNPDNVPEGNHIDLPG